MIGTYPNKAPHRKRRRWPFGPVETYDVFLRPVGFLQIPLPAGVSVRVSQLLNHLPAAAATSDRFILNVEGGAIRYIDSGDMAMSGYGELWPVGVGFFRVCDPQFISLAAESGNAQVNLSLYSSVAE
ncbi:MAG: hypothetical protein C5B59_13740 [Bacteroidetes bacterium]|nr:MAG: hypothetical protein C5B59_13740 [Bacteroidota bacterium]